MRDSVEMERALETQRIALLRLLAGLALVVVVVSRLPAVSLLPQWVRDYVAAQLVRVEAAVQCLIVVAACVILREQSLVSPVGLRFLHGPRNVLPEECPSTAGVFRRIATLRAMLADLPKQGVRLVRRWMRQREEPRPLAFIAPGVGEGRLPNAWVLAHPRIERPPIPDARAFIPRF